MLKLYDRSEIVNRYNKPIYMSSNSVGDTDLERYKNSDQSDKKDKEFIIQGKSDVLTCIVWYNSSSHREDRGYYLKVYNSAGELVEDTFPGLQLGSKSKASVEEVLTDLGLL